MLAINGSSSTGGEGTDILCKGWRGINFVVYIMSLLHPLIFFFSG